MRKLQSIVKHSVCVGMAKKRGVRVQCGRKHFFALTFCGPPRGYFFVKKKVKALEAFELATKPEVW